MYVFNVLAPEVFHDCHITGTLNVPYAELADYVKDFPKNTEIIVYCASPICPMSRKAWQLLQELGFTNVRAYEGGMAEWYSLGYPYEGPAQKDYLKQEYEEPTDGIPTITADELKQKLNL
jgi:rhodanese-related sulfurtransferase